MLYSGTVANGWKEFSSNKDSFLSRIKIRCIKCEEIQYATVSRHNSDDQSMVGGVINIICI